MLECFLYTTYNAMSKGLQNYPQTSAPDSDFPNGNIKDDTGADDGTPVDKQVYADMHQTLAKLLRLSSITANGLPDSEYTGFQYVEAMIGLFGDGRQKVFIVGPPASTLVYGQFNPDVIVPEDTSPGNILSFNIGGAPLISKIKVRNYSFSPIQAVSAGGETFNGVASPFNIPSRSVIDFQLSGSNWVVVERYIMP